MEVTAKLIKELRDLTQAGMMDCKKALVECEGDVKKAIRWLQEQGISKSVKKAGRIASEGVAKIGSNDNTAVIVELNAETDFVAKNEKFQKLANNIVDAVLQNQPNSLDEALELVVDGSKLNDQVIEATATIGEKISFRRFQLMTKNSDQVFGKYVHHDGKKAVVCILNGGDESIAKNIAMQIASMAPQYVSQAEMPQSFVQEQTEIQTNILNNDPVLSTKTEQQKAGIIKARVNKALQGLSLMDQDFILGNNQKVADYLKQNNASVASFVFYTVGEGMEKREDNFAAEVASMTQGK